MGFLLLFPDGALVLEESEIFEESFSSSNILPNEPTIPRYRGKIMGKNDLAWVGFRSTFQRKCGIFEVKRRIALGKLQAILRLRNPSLGHVLSVAGSPRWISRMFPRLRPCVAGLYAFFENKNPFSRNWENTTWYELRI